MGVADPGEEVVLDLVVESAVEEAEDAAADVGGGDDLAAVRGKTRRFQKDLQTLTESPPSPFPPTCLYRNDFSPFVPSLVVSSSMCTPSKLWLREKKKAR